MSLASVRKKGYLYKLPVKGVVKKWSRRWFVLHATTHEGVVRLEYFDDEHHEVTEVGKRTIPLRGSHGIAQSAGSKTRPYVFEFESQLGHHILSVESQHDMDEWISALKEAVSEDKHRKRRQSSQGSVLPSMSEGTQRRVDSAMRGVALDSSNSGVYRVTLEQNETAERLNLTGAYNLEISPTTIALIAANSTAQIAIWPYKSIKSYGKSAGKVNVETGTSAECGAGKFVFVSTCSREIFGIINRNIRKLRDERDKLRLMREAQQVDEAVSGMKKTKEAKASAKRNSSGSTKHNSAHSKPRPRPPKPVPYVETHKGSGVPFGRSGTYRTSRDMEDTTDGLHSEMASSESQKQQYSSGGHSHSPKRVAPAPPQPEDLSALYTPVRKPHKPQPEDLSALYTPVRKPHKPQPEDLPALYTPVRKPHKPAPTHPPSQVAGPEFYTPPNMEQKTSGHTDSATSNVTDKDMANLSADELIANLEASIAALNRTSYTSRDSRDSAIVNQITEGSFTNPLATDNYLPQGVSNPLGYIEDNDLDFKITDIDDELLDTVDEMDRHDGAIPNHKSPTTGQVGAQPSAVRPRPIPKKQLDSRLSQQEIDNIWDEISANMPTFSD